ncbi:MAG TPA: HAMP domain-containing protein, partial [Microbacteriaceae bacterium]|nr:HAMP domain-containing protein [Microbacteriaceae bacterium]
MTLILSTIAAVGVGVAIDLSVRQSLLDARRTQLVTLSQNATSSGQLFFEVSAGQADPDIEAVLNEGLRAIANAAATTSEGTSYALLPAPDQNVPGDFANVVSPSLQFVLDTVVSESLRAAVAADEEGRIYSQSTGIPRADGALVPAIVTGSTVEIRGVRYELYLVYDISDTQQTLSTIQFALGGAGLVLIVLIGVVAFLVVRLVVGPVEVAAATSRRLAAGDLNVRLPVRGDDVLATLATSFNGMAE